MADIKENEFIISGDISTIRTIDSKGNSILSTVDQLTDKMRDATTDKAGLMPAGLFVNIGLRYLDAGESLNLGVVNGFLGVRNSYSWDGISLYWCSGQVATLLAGPSYSIPQSITYVDGEFILKNNGSNRRAFYLFAQNIQF